MMEHEREHLHAFDTLLNDHKIRPFLLYPVSGAAVYILGKATAALGPKAAMACTIAVEEVVGAHYNRQVQDLNSRQEEPKLVETLIRFRDEGLEHRNIAVEQDVRQVPANDLMKAIIQAGCKTAIKMAEKI